MITDNRTEIDLIREALAVQDACNLSGVVHSFARSISRLWQLERAKQAIDPTYQYSTETINKHVVALLFADKIVSLTGTQFDNSKVFEAYRTASDMIEAH